MVEVWIPMVDGRWLMLPRHTQPERDAQAMLNQLQITCRRNRRLASNPLNPPSERPLARLFCGGALSPASTESKALSCCETLELRKLG